jgi:hypothetical protein
MININPKFGQVFSSGQQQQQGQNEKQPTFHFFVPVGRLLSMPFGWLAKVCLALPVFIPIHFMNFPFTGLVRCRPCRTGPDLPFMWPLFGKC